MLCLIFTKCIVIVSIDGHLLTLLRFVIAEEDNRIENRVVFVRFAEHIVEQTFQMF